jgi:Fe-S cluster assembly ATP-binding protein
MPLILEQVHISAKDTPLIHGVSLTVNPGEVHVIMGPNGGGKSTLANTLMGHPKYTVTSGTITLDGTNITTAKPEARAKLGLFLSMQYPPEIDGVGISHFLRTAKESLTGARISPLPFHKELVAVGETLGLSKDTLARSVNVGFSGGEKKRLEMLQLFTLAPTYAILDETDSGLDVDGLKVIGEAIERFRTKDTAVVLITHYTRILDYISPDAVHVLVKGKIVKTGGPELAKEIEQNGYGSF